MQVTLGNQVKKIGTLFVTQSVPANLIIVLVPVLATLIVVGGALPICVVATVCHKVRQKEKRCNQLKLELEIMELVGAKRGISVVKFQF